MRGWGWSWTGGKSAAWSPTSSKTDTPASATSTSTRATPRARPSSGFSRPAPNGCSGWLCARHSAVRGRERALKIAVCLRRVPEMELRFSIASDRRSLDPGGLKYEISDFDGYALEVALQLVEKAGSGEVVAISLGPDGVQETLRKALAMGATRAVQLKADDVPFDGSSIAAALATELRDS